MGCKQAANVPVSALLAGQGQTDLLLGSVPALMLSLETTGRILLASVVFSRCKSSFLLQGQAPTAMGQTPGCCMSQTPGNSWDMWPVCYCDWRHIKAACLTTRQDSRRCAQLAEHCPACVFPTYLKGFMTQKFFMGCKKGNLHYFLFVYHSVTPGEQMLLQLLIPTKQRLVWSKPSHFYQASGGTTSPRSWQKWAVW